jgi:hypothetical protein
MKHLAVPLWALVAVLIGALCGFLLAEYTSPFGRLYRYREQTPDCTAALNLIGRTDALIACLLRQEENKK